MLDPLQGACVSCKSRRVRCDSSKPSCDRCRKDGIDCPGYVKIRQWSTSNSSYVTHRRFVKRKSKKLEDERAEPLQLASPNTSTSESGVEPPEQYYPPWPLSPLPKKDTPLIADCIKCLNQKHLPERLLPQQPFNRKRYELAYHPSMPQLLQNLLVVIVRTREAMSNDIDPRSDATICRYRSRSLNELKRLVGGAVSESNGFTLSCIILFMLADLRDIPSGTWSYHLEAARKINLLRGGLLQCFRSLPNMRPLLGNFMLVDIFAATTSHSRLLKGSLDSLRDYVDVLACADEVNAHGYLFKPVLKEIIYTTILRVSRKTGVAPAVDFKSIRQSLDSFNARAWVNRVTSHGRVHPEKASECVSAEAIAGWSAFAAAYKFAALLYLLLSCGSTDKDAHDVHGAKRTLTTSVQFLINTGSSGFDAPLQAQLWRLLDWPILVSTYVCIGWTKGDESVDEEVGRLDRITKETGRKGAATEFIKRALVKRWQTSDEIWCWDDGLDLRSPFYFA